MRIRLLLALLAAVALTVGAALGFLAEQATQPSDFGQPANRVRLRPIAPLCTLAMSRDKMTWGYRYIRVT